MWEFPVSEVLDCGEKGGAGGDAHRLLSRGIVVVVIGIPEKGNPVPEVQDLGVIVVGRTGFEQQHLPVGEVRGEAGCYDTASCAAAGGGQPVEAVVARRRKCLRYPTMM